MTAIDALVALPPGLYRLRSARSSDAISHSLAARGRHCWIVELGEVRSRRGALNAFERALDGPESWGRSWEALYELLTDDSGTPDATDRRPRVLILADAAAFARADPREWSALLDHLWDAVRQRSTRAAPLTVLIRRPPASAAQIREVVVA